MTGDSQEAAPVPPADDWPALSLLPDAAEPDAPIENHPLASVLGSFADDLPALDAIMAGVEEYRRRLEADEDVP